MKGEVRDLNMVRQKVVDYCVNHDAQMGGKGTSSEVRCISLSVVSARVTEQKEGHSRWGPLEHNKTLKRS